METKVLNMDEIKARYPDRWVILDQVRSDPGPVLRAGRVIFSSVVEKDCYQFVKKLPDGFHIAIRFMGYPPEDISFAL